MRCKTCDYPLWNLPSRTCPECGAPFAPGDFEFVPNSVRFCCPHCAQPYYGTGEKGHLDPDAFTCVRCGRPVRMDEMVLVPTEGVGEEQTRVDTVPWLDRGKRGFFRGWLGTIGMAMVRPGRLAAAMPEGHGTGAAWWFAILTGTVYFLMAGAALGLPLLVAPAGGGPGLGVLAGYALAGPICTVVGLAFWTLCTHGILRLGGRPAHGMSRTAACLCYACATNVLAAIPCVGFYMIPLSWIWPAASASVMLSKAHGISGTRAAVAAVIPPLLGAAVIVVAFTLTVYFGVRAGAAAAAAAVGGGQLQTMSMVTGLTTYAARNSGTSPPHAVALLGARQVTMQDFFVSGVPPSPADRTVSGIDFGTLDGVEPLERAAAVNAAGASLPAGTVAHRFGDMVFVYHGMDLGPASTADPGLWLVVCAPLTSNTASAPQPFVAGDLSGGIRFIVRSQLPSMLAGQNALRAAEGLPPIPDPTTVTQSRPAVAGGVPAPPGG